MEIEGVSFATTTVTSWPPVARMRLMVRSMTLHIDYPSTLEVFFALSDAMGRTRVEMDGLALSMSFTPSGGGSIDLGSSACAMSSFDAGVGRCSISLSQVMPLHMSDAMSTASRACICPCRQLQSATLTVLVALRLDQKRVLLLLRIHGLCDCKGCGHLWT